MNLIKNINNLPIEIQDKIYKYYWSYNYKLVTDQISNVFKLEYNVLSFLKKYKNNNIQDQLKYYYKKYNYFIKDIIEDKGTFLISKVNNLKTSYYCPDLYKNVNIDYRYIAPILISLSGVNRYYKYYEILAY